MNNLPLISVIIPAYNSEKWLKDCCESVFEQTYPNIELVVVDDGSTDKTLGLARSFAEDKENVQVIHTENGGVCKARNTGIEASSGDYIAFLDSDDLLVHNALEILYSELMTAQADIAIGWKCNMTAEGKDLGCPFERASGIFEGTEGLKLSLEDYPAMYAVWGKLYKRSAIGEIRFVEGKKVHEDSFFVFECLMKQPRVVICDSVVLRYRFTENSASRSSFSEKFFDILYFAERKKKYIDEIYPEYSDLSENVLIKAHLALLKNLCKTKDRKYRAHEKNSIRELRKRKKYFIPAFPDERRIFRIVTHHLYGLYKYVYYPIRIRMLKR